MKLREWIEVLMMGLMLSMVAWSVGTALAGGVVW
jgi:hypothetical protein